MLAPDARPARGAIPGLAMSGGATSATSERAEFAGSRLHGRRWVTVAVVLMLVLIAAGVLALVGGVFDGGGGSSGPADDRVGDVVRDPPAADAVADDAVQRHAGLCRLLHGFGAGAWQGHIAAQGGARGHQGQVLYRADQVPVVLLYGAIPAYRALAEGATGADVAQLNHDLVSLGYLYRSEVGSAWREFNWATSGGVKRLQRHLGVDETGKVSLGNVVFLPTAARVTGLRAGLGAPATGPVIQASSTARTVSVALNPDLQSKVRAGDRVRITLPDGSTTPGRVTSVGRVATPQFRRIGQRAHRAGADPTNRSEGHRQLGSGTRGGGNHRPDGAQRPRAAGVLATRARWRRLFRRSGRQRQHAPPGAGEAGLVRRRGRNGAGVRGRIGRRTASGGARRVSGAAATVLEVDRVSKTYPGAPPVAALRGVSLTLTAGELAAVVGPSGSGKTTLLHVMGSLDRPSAGTVKLTGLDVAACRTASSRRFGPAGWASCFSSSSSPSTRPCWTTWPTGCSTPACRSGGGGTARARRCPPSGCPSGCRRAQPRSRSDSVSG